MAGIHRPPLLRGPCSASLPQQITGPAPKLRTTCRVARNRSRFAASNPHGNARPGYQTVAVHFPAEPRLYGLGGCGANARNWDEYGNFFRSQFGAAETGAISRPGPAGGVHEHLATGLRTGRLAHKISA